MKKRIFLFLLVMTAATMTMMAQNIALKTYKWSSNKKPAFGTMTIDINCNLPANTNSAITKAIYTWGCKKINDESRPINDLNIYIQIVGQSIQNDFNSQLVEMRNDGMDVELCNMEKSIRITKSYEDAQYITMNYELYEYAGGAHGSHDIQYATFRKSDGHIMGWDLMGNTPKSQIRQLIKKGLCKYFEVRTMAELKDYLMVENFSQFPLPTNPPYLAADGVHVIYQEYEIAPYAAGMPECIIKRSNK